MGFWDTMVNWFSSNKHRLSDEERREFEKMMENMRSELHDKINSSNNSTSQKLEHLISMASNRMNSNVEDTRQYCTNEMKRLSDELNDMRQQLDKEKKEKKEKKSTEESAKENKVAIETNTALEMMKLCLEHLKSNNSSAAPPSGYPSHPGHEHWRQSPAPAPGYQNVCHQQHCGNANPANQQGYYVPNGPPSHSSASSMPPLVSAPPISSATPFYSAPPIYSAPLTSSTPPSSTPTPSSIAPPSSPGIYPNLPPPASSIDSSGNKSEARRSQKDSPKKLVLPDKRDYKKYGIEFDENDLSSVSKKLTSTPSANLDSQLGCGLILPDSRDYNKIVSASIQKKRVDDEFEKVINDFSREYRPGSGPNPTNRTNEMKIANEVKNFFLKDKEKRNAPKMPVSRTSASNANASVQNWLNNTGNVDSDDDSSDGNRSVASVRSNTSRFSSMSVTSGKRVFQNKSGNYGKPAPVGSSSSRNAYKNNSHEPTAYKGNANNRFANKNRHRNTNKEQKDSNLVAKDNDLNASAKEKKSNFIREKKRSNASVKSSSSGTLTEIHYPSRREAERNGLDLHKPLDRKLLFLGKNEDDEWTTHTPKCLKDIYDLEKEYDEFRTIEIG